MLVATAALAAASAAVAGPASAAAPAAKGDADTPKTFARLAGHVTVDPKDPTVGYVKAVYRCYGQGGLWVSVKQTADRSRDPRLQAPESSSISAAWSDSHRNPVTCDGKTHEQVFTVDQLEPSWSPPAPHKSDVYKPLANGWAWVQFCLFDANYTEAPYSENQFERVLAH